MAVVQVKACYVVGGGVVERYEGETQFSMNADDHATYDELFNEASERARNKVARSGCWVPSLVVINDIYIN
jgi:hypothetical protein